MPLTRTCEYCAADLTGTLTEERQAHYAGCKPLQRRKAAAREVDLKPGPLPSDVLNPQLRQNLWTWQRLSWPHTVYRITRHGVPVAYLVWDCEPQTPATVYPLHAGESLTTLAPAATRTAMLAQLHETLGFYLDLK